MLGAAGDVAPVVQREAGIKSTCRFDTVQADRSIASTVDGPGIAARRSAPPVLEVLGWEIDQGALTSTRTLPEISAFAAIANASLTSSKGST